MYALGGCERGRLTSAGVRSMRASMLRTDGGSTEVWRNGIDADTQLGNVLVWAEMHRMDAIVDAMVLQRNECGIIRTLRHPSDA